MGKLSTQFNQWLYDHVETYPKLVSALETTVGVTYLFSTAAYNLARLPDRLLRGAWDNHVAPLEKFEPDHTDHGHNTRSTVNPPYWQDLVFGDGRLEKLLTRLDGMPAVDMQKQKWLLTISEAGLRDLPGQRGLIRYGLNDLDIAHAANILREVIFDHRRTNAETNEERIENWKRLKAIPLTLTETGLKDPNGQSLAQREDIASRIHFDTSLSQLYDWRKTEDAGTAFAIAGEVYDWLREDVAPAVPAIFRDYLVTTDHAGIITATHQPDGYDSKNPEAAHYSRVPKSFYEILRGGYKGTLPAYDSVQALHAPTPAP